jgi:multicomponent K+:H+ antiporter subunit A
MAAVAAVFHILNHALFKAALFMSAGIVDHEAGTRDVRRLGGLARLMPISAGLAIIASASMAGLPFLNGFLSKEMMLEEAAHTTYAGTGWLLPALATLGAVLSVAYSARLAIATYMGPKRSDYPHPPHDPPMGLWAPVAVLIVPVVVIGLVPAWLAGPLVARTAQAVIGSAALPDYHLSLWHGFTPALYMSLIAFAVGFGLVARQAMVDGVRRRFVRPEAKRMFDVATETLIAAAQKITDGLHTNSLPRYLAFIFATILIVGAVGYGAGAALTGPRALLPVNLPSLVVWAALALTCGVVVLTHANRLLTLILTSVVGLAVSLAFVQFSAPDLALTQISVEVVTTVLLLLALNLLPRVTPSEVSALRRMRDGAIAILGGLGAAALAFAVMTRDVASISDYHLAQSKPGGGGTNVVNVILVDFRGFDTFGEIIVLCIAALSIYALLSGALRGTAAKRLAGMLQAEEAADAHPLLLVVVTRVLLPLAITVGAFIFLRGHNQPGGGFIAGLVVAIAFVMQAVASGHAWAVARQRIDAHTMLGLGVLIAGLTGLTSILLASPFLTSAFDYFSLPLIGSFELASAMAFDLGVFLAVVGTVILSLSQIARVQARAERKPVPQGPSDIPLARSPSAAAQVSSASQAAPVANAIRGDL